MKTKDYQKELDDDVFNSIAASAGASSAPALQQEFRASRSTIAGALRRLADAGRIVATGEKRGRRYSVANGKAAAPPVSDKQSELFEA